MKAELSIITESGRKVLIPMDDEDCQCFVKAKSRGQRTFTLVEQDVTAAATIQFWASLQLNDEKSAKGMSDAMEFANSKIEKKYAD